MKKILAALISIYLLSTPAFAVGRIQNEDVKSSTDIKSANGTITGNLTSTNVCIASPSSTAGLATGQFIYDTTTPANINSGVTIAGLPGSCSAGQIQMSAGAAGSGTGDAITFGGQLSQLINDTKVYVTGLSINDTLANAITNGSIAQSTAAKAVQYNIGFTTSVAANALTVALKQADGSTDCSSASPCRIGFRSTTLTTGSYTLVSVTGALSVVAPSGTTIGTVSGAAENVYVYAINNAGTVELALSLNPAIDVGALLTTAAISGGSSRTAAYSTSARTSVAVRLLGKINITEATAGTWASGATSIALQPFMPTQEVVARMNSSTTSLTSGVDTKVVFANIDYDPFSMVNGGKDTFTIPAGQGGYYNFCAYALGPSTTQAVGSQFEVILYKNGSQAALLQELNSSAAAAYRMSGSGCTDYAGAAGDTFQFYVNADKAGSIPSGTANSSFSIHKIR